MNIIIQAATLNDIPALLACEQGVITAERPFDVTIVPDPTKYYDLELFINSPDVELLVAKIDDEIVGSGYVRILTNQKSYLNYTDYAYLGFMYVKPAYRGKGVNNMVVEALKQWAISRSITELKLDVYNDNLPAVRAYEKVGFSKLLVEMRMGLK